MAITNLRNIEGITLGIRDIEVIDLDTAVEDRLVPEGCIAFTTATDSGATVIVRLIDGSTDVTYTVPAAGGVVGMGNHPFIITAFRATSTATAVQIGWV